jgi:putative lipoic acid-binding regulatory protein
MKEKNTEEFYSRLIDQLNDTTKWPSDYLFKFIVPTQEEKIRAISDIFHEEHASINHKQSTKGTYTSVSIKIKLESAEEVVIKYKAVSKVEGVISL